MEFLGFTGPAYEARSRYQDAQLSVNWYPEPSPEAGAKTPMTLYPTPGLSLFWNVPSSASITASPVRFAYSPPSRRELCVLAVGNKLVTVVPNGASYTFATSDLQSNVGPMSAADNGTTILIVDGSDAGYTVDIATGTVGSISGGDGFYGGDRVVCLDSVFVLNKPDTNQFYWSDLVSTTFDPLNFASKEASPDLLMVAWAEHRELWLLGQYTTEVWYNSGNGGAETFARNDGVFLQHGCAAVHSVSRLGETFAFLSTDERGSYQVKMAQGYGLQTISTPALDYEFAQYETVDDAIAFTYRASGHEFYQLTFPNANKTWVYDVNTQMWHQRGYLNAQGDIDRHRANCFVNYRGSVLVGDQQNGLVYEYAEDVYTDNGSAIARIRRCPHIINDRKEVRYNWLEVEFQPGVGLTTGQGSDPQAMLRWSDDGGSTWSNEHWTSIGASGNYRARAYWMRLGSARDRVFEVRVTDPVNAVVIGSTLDVSG